MPITSSLDFPRSQLFLFLQHPHLRELVEAVSSIRDEQLGGDNFTLEPFGYTVASYIGATQHINGGVWKMENHQRDVDLHFVLDGNQQILYAPAKGLSVTDEYDKANDTEMLAAPKIYRTIPLQAGDFTFLFPGEAHSPRWQHDPEVTFVKTAIVKIPLAKLRHNLA